MINEFKKLQDLLTLHKIYRYKIAGLIGISSAQLSLMWNDKIHIDPDTAAKIKAIVAHLAALPTPPLPFAGFNL